MWSDKYFLQFFKNAMLKISSPVHNNQQPIIDENENKENNPVGDVSPDSKGKFISKEKNSGATPPAKPFPTSEIFSTPIQDCRLNKIKTSDLENSGSSTSSSETNDFIKNSANILDTVVTVKKESHLNICSKEPDQKEVTFSTQEVPGEICLNSTYNTSNPINLNTTITKDCHDGNSVFDSTYSLNTNSVSDVILPEIEDKSNDQQVLPLKADKYNQIQRKFDESTPEHKNIDSIKFDKTFISPQTQEFLDQSLQNGKEEIELALYDKKEKTDNHQNGSITLNSAINEEKVIELNDKSSSETIIIEDSLQDEKIDESAILVEQEQRPAKESANVLELKLGVDNNTERSVSEKKEESEWENDLIPQNSSSRIELQLNDDELPVENRDSSIEIETCSQLNRSLETNDNLDSLNIESNLIAEKKDSTSTSVNENDLDSSTSILANKNSSINIEAEENILPTGLIDTISQGKLTDTLAIITTDENTPITVETDRNIICHSEDYTAQTELSVDSNESDGNTTIVAETEEPPSEIEDCTPEKESRVKSNEFGEENTTEVADCEKCELEVTSEVKSIIVIDESVENIILPIEIEKNSSGAEVTCSTESTDVISTENHIKDVEVGLDLVPLKNCGANIPENFENELKKMADTNEKLQQENSDLKLELNAAKQAKSSLELEVSKKDEIILKTQADALKKEQQYLQDLKILREQLKEKLSDNDNIKELEEALKEAKAKESQAISKLNAKINDELKNRKILEEYEKSIALYTVNSQKLKEENKTLSTHLSNLELSFSDLHQKYERTKVMIDGFKSNEEKLKKQASAFEENFCKQEAKYDSLKSHAKTQIDKCNKDIAQFREKADAEIIKFKAIIKRLEIKNAALENSLEQKTKECLALSALCEEVTGEKI